LFSAKDVQLYESNGVKVYKTECRTFVFMCEDQTFIGINFTEHNPEFAEYENCTFKNCVFTSLSLSDIKFIDCEFIECDLSLVICNNTLFRQAKFSDCKMLGISFDNCSSFGLSFSFRGCNLNHSSFHGLSIKKQRFESCELQETDFTDTNLTQAMFIKCNLAGALFQQTNLEHADVRTAENFDINIKENKVQGLKIQQQQSVALLRHFKIKVE